MLFCKVEGGSKGEGREAPMSQNTQAQNDVEQMAAPEGDRVLEGGFRMPIRISSRCRHHHTWRRWLRPMAAAC